LRFLFIERERERGSEGGQGANDSLWWWRVTFF